MKFHYNDNKYLDREHLDSFIERFFRVIILDFLKVEKGQEVYVYFRLVSKDFTFLSRLMLITNDPKSLYNLKDEVLYGPLGILLDIYEPVDMFPDSMPTYNGTQCYFHYKLK